MKKRVPLLDVGLKDFAILSDETIYENPKYFRKLEAKLAKAQRVLSKRKAQVIKQKRKLSEAKNYKNKSATLLVFMKRLETSERTTCIIFYRNY
ncbi:hypothetical protein J32TS6_13830 [Virgibacillus pantothenticus]|nr:hypothetical protein J32TS6_13830 [Virgibacillus pantothenticus]